jgi:enoyl-[acyl-carrier protein] reductase I
MTNTAKLKLLEGKKGLVVGIANDQSIAWGCAKAFRAFGAELAVTYLNDKAKKCVEPLARQLNSAIVMPFDARVPGQMEALFESVAKTWGKLDFVVHSIAFSPKEALEGRVTDAGRLSDHSGNLLLDFHPHGAFSRATDARRWHVVHHDLLRQSDGGEEL